LRLFAMAALAGSVSATMEFSPAFFWSPTSQAATTSAIEHLGAVTGVDVERVSSMLMDGQAAKAPEVRLVFLVEGLGTEVVRQHGSRLPTVDKLLHSSATSLTMPFTTAHDTQLFSRAVRVAGSDVEEYLKNHASIFTDGVPDTVVVELTASGASTAEQLASHDELVARVTRAVDAGTHGNYAALLTAMRGAAARPAHRRLSSTPLPAAYLHTTPTLLTAQMVMLILIVIFLSGFCCLFSLQTPKKFNDTAKEAS